MKGNFTISILYFITLCSFADAIKTMRTRSNYNCAQTKWLLCVAFFDTFKKKRLKTPQRNKGTTIEIQMNAKLCGWFARSQFSICFSHCRAKLQLWCWRWIFHSFYTKHQNRERPPATRTHARIHYYDFQHKQTMQQYRSCVVAAGIETESMLFVGFCFHYYFVCTTCE